MLHNKRYPSLRLTHSISATFSPTKPDSSLRVSQEPRWDSEYPSATSDFLGTGLSMQWSHCSRRSPWVFPKWVSFTGSWTWSYIPLLYFFIFSGDEGENRTTDLALHNLTSCIRRHCREKKTNNKNVAQQTLPDFKSNKLDFPHTYWERFRYIWKRFRTGDATPICVTARNVLT